ncbi:hypothetical protein CJD36_021675 [Flavipsychrobacter stenotrophus]|uniref:Uncharacterized protein n=1 Tax=Flavipsychrobacter stenotrophus TaxID=2077091 RepID=A0A2S7SPQ9_9BACT|nr:hypothetical protein [Flavipsychrobacter stenotrophus]PQJ08882.1 hypothetical protein CJD36_021675 [Flavipsychrobacter stenotrophus]
MLLHELGHAVAARILTKDKVSVFIGSYGNKEKSFRIPLGKLEVFYCPSLLSFSQGLCIPAAKDISTRNRIIFLACGPLASLVTATAVLGSVVLFQAQDILRIGIIALAASAISDLFANLIPIRKAFKLHSGSIAYNDGFTILKLLNWQRYQKIIPLYNQFNEHKQYVQALELIEPVFKPKISYVEIYRKALISAQLAGEYGKMMIFYEMAVPNTQLTSGEHNSMGLLFAVHHRIEEAFEAFDRAISIDPANVSAILNQAFCHLSRGDYGDAIADYNKCLNAPEHLAYTLANVGLAKIKLADTVAGLDDINRAKEISPNEPYVYRSLGIYYMDTGKTEEALANFNKCRELDSNCHVIDQLIEQANGQTGWY